MSLLVFGNNPGPIMDTYFKNVESMFLWILSPLLRIMTTKNSLDLQVVSLWVSFPE